MASSSGIVNVGMLPPGSVIHAASGTEYRIDAGGQVHFVRGKAAGARDAAFFIGSGAAARSLLWQREGFLFQLPVTWYKSSGWEMSPGYETSARVILARPIEPECLNCHATDIRHKPGTQNGYNWPPAGETGVGCERCHGPGAQHVKSGNRAHIVNPAKLAAPLRDSVCAQCHLMGAERVFLPEKASGRFTAGESFQSYAISFVWANPESNGLHTTSHFERLEMSACKKRSGGRLWCGTCHDPHAAIATGKRSEFYRTRCMDCHEGSAHAAQHSDCIGCHMPRQSAKDARLAAFTDHSIPPRASIVAGSADRELKPFRGEAGPRELGLAWARIAAAGNRGEDFAAGRDLLRRAYADGARDAAVLTTLAFLEDRAGNEDRAIILYEASLKLDPAQPEVLVNLGSSYATRGRLREAIRLWQDAAQRSPGMEPVWIKLATASAALGHAAEAINAVRTCLFYHPGSEPCLEIDRGLDH